MLNKSKILNIKNKVLKGKNCTLKKITSLNCNQNYLSWMNNKKVNRYLESRFENFNRRKLMKFVTDSNKDYSTILYGIFYNNIHVGNIKISINWHHGYAILGYLVGNLNFQGKNIGTESIKICANICFKHLKLRFCLASIYSNNFPSYKVLKKNKFRLVAKLKKKYKLKAKSYVDELTFRLNNPYLKN